MTTKTPRRRAPAKRATPPSRTPPRARRPRRTVSRPSRRRPVAANAPAAGRRSSAQYWGVIGTLIIHLGLAAGTVARVHGDAKVEDADRRDVIGLLATVFASLFIAGAWFRWAPMLAVAVMLAGAMAPGLPVLMGVVALRMFRAPGHNANAKLFLGLTAIYVAGIGLAAIIGGEPSLQEWPAWDLPGGFTGWALTTALYGVHPLLAAAVMFLIGGWGGHLLSQLPWQDMLARIRTRRAAMRRARGSNPPEGDDPHDGGAGTGNDGGTGTGNDGGTDSAGTSSQPAGSPKPPAKILQTSPQTPAKPGAVAECEEVKDKLNKVLTDAKVNARVAEYQHGPTVTQYEIELAPGERVDSVEKLRKDFAYWARTPSVLIIPVIPGKERMGIQVPNRKREIVRLGDMLQAAARLPDVSLAMFGRLIDGAPLFRSLASLPHMLIAGATGAGKSMYLRALITWFLMRATPADLGMLLIDPKRVELTDFEDLPHLLRPIITDPVEAIEALKWAVAEMDDRYDLFAKHRVRDIGAYNKAIRKGKVPGEPMQRLLIVVDELADLMVVVRSLGLDLDAEGKKKPHPVEEAVVRLSQLARAAGIHLVLATQRPSVDVVTGLIKANMPCRVAFAVTSATDAGVIAVSGADHLLGQGDMLIVFNDAAVPVRCQGPYVSDEEVQEVAGHWASSQEPPQAPPAAPAGEPRPAAPASPAAPPKRNAAKPAPSKAPAEAAPPAPDGSDAAWLAERKLSVEDLVRLATLMVNTGHSARAMVQRKLGLGWDDAGHVLGILHRAGVLAGDSPNTPSIRIAAGELNPADIRAAVG